MFILTKNRFYCILMSELGTKCNLETVVDTRSQIMERKYWIEGNVVMGNCHECGTPRKFADIVRMSAEDVEDYRAARYQKPLMSELQVWILFGVLLSLLTFYLDKQGPSLKHISTIFFSL